MRRELSTDERKKLQKLSAKAIEQYLDSGAGSCHLRNPTTADEVANALTQFDNQRYRLFAWCVMPNHVHIVVRLFSGHTLASVVQAWKSFSAHRSNKLLNLKGPFWQREYYDHLIRDESEFERAVRYVGENPIKAGLQDWRWVWVCGPEAHTTAAGDGGATL